MELRDNGMCFVCGPKNPIGLKLEFALEDGKYVTHFTPGPEHAGFIGITHGGIVSTVLDEVMARLVWVLGHKAVTAEMSIRLKKPAVTGEELTVAGWIASEGKRIIECAAEARNPAGDIVAEATARMLRV